jgi:hypothetical protein
VKGGIIDLGKKIFSMKLVKWDKTKLKYLWQVPGSHIVTDLIKQGCCVDESIRSELKNGDHAVMTLNGLSLCILRKDYCGCVLERDVKRGRKLRK